MKIETLDNAIALRNKIIRIKQRLEDVEEVFQYFKKDGQKYFLLINTYYLIKSDLESQLSKLKKQLEEL